MKKRIFMLAVVVGVLLSLSVSAWADGETTYYYKLGKVTPPNATYNAESTTDVSLEYQVEVSYANTATDGYYVNANLLSWEVENFEVSSRKIQFGTQNATELDNNYSIMDPTSLVNAESSGVTTDAGTVAAKITLTGKVTSDTSPVSVTFSLYSNDGDAVTDSTTISTVLESGAATTTDEATTVYTDKSEADYEAAQTTDDPGTTDDPEVTHDVRNYDDDDPKLGWNGLNPPFTNAPKHVSFDYTESKAKPAIKISKASFSGGTSKDLKIDTITGPITELNVYIAAKDAMKLYPTEGFTKDSDPIVLTKENIKKYNIPFRVTSYDLGKTITSKNEKDAKKAWKNLKNSVTISFNGGKVQYKGFPITISAKNEVTGDDKPVAKTLKIDVTPNASLPYWIKPTTVEKGSGDVTAATAWEAVEGQTTEPVYKTVYVSEDIVTTTVTTAATEEGGDATETTVAVKAADWGWASQLKDTGILSSDGECYMIPTYYKTADLPTTAEDPTSDPEEQTGGDTGNNGSLPANNGDSEYTLNTEGYIYSATPEDAIDYYTLYAETYPAYDKKDKPEVVAAINTATEKEDEKVLSEFYAIYTASGDGPYTITVKPDPNSEKDQTKIEAFFKEGAKAIEIVQPTYDYLGKITEHGYVEFSGTPAKTDKENKLAFTLTATNTSTKKKGALKVTAIAKTIPAFDKVTKDSYGNAWISTKRVEAGKTPSVKFKAKGSKTIAYKLGDYYWDSENKTLATEAEDDNTELAEKLAALALSFDSKKGAVILASKSNKNTLPTLNEDEDAFKSLDIVVTAYNNAGSAQAYAHVAITGAKPKMETKNVTFNASLTDQTLKAKVGRSTASATTAGANVRFIPDEDGKATLNDLGLKLLHWDDMEFTVYKTVSDEATIASGDQLTGDLTKVLVNGKGTIVKTRYYASGAALPADWETTYYSGDKTAVKETEGEETAATTYTAGTGGIYLTVDTATEEDDATYVYFAGKGGITIYSGDKEVVSEDAHVSADASYKNTAILRVSNASQLKAAADEEGKKDKKYTINMTLENLGATNKGKVTIIVAKALGGSNGSLPGSNKAANNWSSSSAARKTGSAADYAHNNGALPDGAEGETDEDAAQSEKLTIGEPRTVADLTAGQQAFLAEKGYTVVAVLPEITADVSDQYKLEDIELDEEAPEGATLIWIAFPKNAPASEDDDIVDFYDEAGAPVEGVPASHKIIAYPWLREAVTYEPVIAIEAK